MRVDIENRCGIDQCLNLPCEIRNGDRLVGWFHAIANLRDSSQGAPGAAYPNAVARALKGGGVFIIGDDILQLRSSQIQLFVRDVELRPARTFARG